MISSKARPLLQHLSLECKHKATEFESWEKTGESVPLKKFELFNAKEIQQYSPSDLSVCPIAVLTFLSYLIDYNMGMANRRHLASGPAGLIPLPQLPIPNSIVLSSLSDHATEACEALGETVKATFPTEDW
jgi:hypothetical protein